MKQLKKEITVHDVIEFLELCEQNDIEIIIDGGWGVDALLGKQTRIHADLDIALQHKYVPKLRQLLEARGYIDIPRDDTRECNFVMGDNKGHEIDFHSFTFDEKGNHIFGIAYPLESLTGTGIINGHTVKCISPEWMVKFHTGYPLDENDYRDVLALCEHFGIPLPSEYAKFSTVQQPLYINNLSSLIQALSQLPQKRLILIGIDGRPGSGKTTIAIKLEEALQAQTIYLDGFFIPQEQWSPHANPQFPFFYFRYQEFIDGVKALAVGKPFSYFTYDWETSGLSAQPKVIKPVGIIIVEGVSALNTELAPLYDKKIWVASDRNSEFAAIAARENETNLDLWNNIYLPSVDLYCLQKPWQRADIIYAGRGIQSQEQLEKVF